MKPPMVGYINMQKSLVEIGGLGNKSMGKIASLCDNNSYINLPLGRGYRGYVWGQFLKVRATDVEILTF